MSPTKIAQSATIAIILCFTIWAYSSGLGGGFILDDNANIVKKSEIQIDSLDPDTLWKAALSGTSGPLLRPVSMLTFALNYYASGLDPVQYKITNLLIHISVGVGLFVLTILLLRSTGDRKPSNDRIIWIAIATTSAWILHPINLTSVLYVVQRMTSLAALFMAWGAVFYAIGRIKLQESQAGWPWILFGILILGPLAIFSKENGVLLPLYLFIIEICIFRFETKRHLDRQLLLAVYFVPLLLVASVLVYEIISHPGFFSNGYLHRNFTLEERLLTEARILWWYIRMILLPNVSEMGIFLDDFPLSTGFFSPPLTALAVSGLVALIVLAVVSLRKLPILSFGIFWFLGSHILESTIFPLELAYEHRNYLAVYGVMFTLFFYLLNPVKDSKIPLLNQSIAILFILWIGFTVSIRTHTWASEPMLILTQVKNHPLSPRSNYYAGSMFAKRAGRNNPHREEYIDKAKHYFSRSYDLNPTMVSGLIALIYMNSEMGTSTPETLLKEISSSLQIFPMEASSVNAIGMLTECEIKNICNLPPSRYLEIITGALSNENSSSTYRAGILHSASKYFSEKIADHTSAIHYSRLAITENPNLFSAYTTLANLLIETGELAEARDVLEEFQQRDILGSHNMELNEAIEALDATIDR